MSGSHSFASKFCAHSVEITKSVSGLTGLEDISGVKSPYKCQEARSSGGAVVTCISFWSDASLGKSQVLGMERLAFWSCDVVDKVILDGSSLEMLKLETLPNIAMRHARSQQLAVHFPGLRRRKCLVLCFSNLQNSVAFSIVEDMHTLRCRHREMCKQ